MSGGVVRRPVLKCSIVALAVCTLFSAALRAGNGATDLFVRGYSVLPAPQKVQLESADASFGPQWTYRAEVPSNHIAIRSLTRDLADFQSVTLKAAGPKEEPALRLTVKEGSVRSGISQEVDAQAYRLRIASGRIEITGNSDAGLFYGAQTLVQLLRKSAQGALLLPVCAIEDWPDLPLRFLHWDTKHHQDRIETLKRYIDWSARFKINRIGFELEDKFSYPSHPVIGAPGAFTPAELQEIVDYGLERFVEVVPQIQSPAHMAFVLKHPEFADLKADGNNYQVCMCDERALALIFSMYDDVIKATRGVHYFHVSTDEVYFAGLCGKCPKPFTDENRSLAWIEFAKKAYDFVQSRGRTMLAWVEYPVLPQHVKLLPPGIINGVQPGDAEQLAFEKEIGMRDLIYTSLQGEEPLFPNMLPLPGVSEEGRLEGTQRAFEAGKHSGNAVGVYGAAWDDSGLHSETFWPGWAAVAGYGWNSAGPSVPQQLAEFVNAYYGRAVSGMPDIYLGLQKQARFFEHSWDQVVSRVRAEGYGNSNGKGVGTTRFDDTLPAPALPEPAGLTVTPVYQGKYAKLIEEAKQAAADNDILQMRIVENISRAERNRYSLEVFLSLAELMAHHNRMVRGLGTIESFLQRAQQAALLGNARRACSQLENARKLALEIVAERKSTFAALQKVWEKERFPKGREVNGRKFVHVLDDVKDHWADRRPDLSYMVTPEESIGLEKWAEQLGSIARSYLEKHKHSLGAPEE
jgi:hexosaminidase